jgi:hypothetical protein
MQCSQKRVPSRRQYDSSLYLAVPQVSQSLFTFSRGSVWTFERMFRLAAVERQSCRSARVPTREPRIVMRFNTTSKSGNGILNPQLTQPAYARNHNPLARLRFGFP